MKEYKVPSTKERFHALYVGTFIVSLSLFVLAVLKPTPPVPVLWLVYITYGLWRVLWGGPWPEFRLYLEKRRRQAQINSPNNPLLSELREARALRRAKKWSLFVTILAQGPGSRGLPKSPRVEEEVRSLKSAIEENDTKVRELEARSLLLRSAQGDDSLVRSAAPIETEGEVLVRPAPPA